MYDRVKISFITGHNPDLLVLRKPIKRIDLTTYNTTESLHGLFIKLKLKFKDENRGKMCASWGKKFCNKYRRHLSRECGSFCIKH